MAETGERMVGGLGYTGRQSHWYRMLYRDPQDRPTLQQTSSTMDEEDDLLRSTSSGSQKLMHLHPSC